MKSITPASLSSSNEMGKLLIVPKYPRKKLSEMTDEEKIAWSKKSARYYDVQEWAIPIISIIALLISILSLIISLR